MATLITEPRVQYQRLPNPKFTIVPGSLTKTYFFGTSSNTLTVSQEAVERTSNTSENLVNMNVHTITSIFDENGVVYFNTTNFTLTNADAPAAYGTVDWSVNLAASPAVGVTYYVTYEKNKTFTTLSIEEVDSVDDAEDLFGVKTSSTNRLSIAADLYFGNGAIRGYFIQTADTTNSSIDAALALMVPEELDIIVPMIGCTTANSVLSKTKAHVFQQSSVETGGQRIALLGGAVGTSIVDFRDTLAAQASYERLVLTAPGSCEISINDVDTVMDGTFYNAAIAGFLSDPDNDVAVPTTRKQLYGFSDVGVTYTRTQSNDLVAHGILVVEKKNGVIRVRHGVTTDVTDLNSSELSVVRIGDFIGNLLRQVLEKIYIGTKIDTTAVASIRTTIETVLNSLINKVIIVKFADLQVTQNLTNPVVIDVQFKVYPVFPLNLIDIKFSFDTF